MTKPQSNPQTSAQTPAKNPTTSVQLPTNSPEPSSTPSPSAPKSPSSSASNPEPTATHKPKAKKLEKHTNLTRGGRNLVLLGLGASLIAVVTTVIGLAIYHLSGDIYLDRSRPGYLPDEAEVVEEAESEPAEFNFEKSGKLTREQLEEYLKHLTEEINAVDKYKDPFTESALSDDRLGIPKE